MFVVFLLPSCWSAFHIRHATSNWSSIFNRTLADHHARIWICTNEVKFFNPIHANSKLLGPAIWINTYCKIKTRSQNLKVVFG